MQPVGDNASSLLSLAESPPLMPTAPSVLSHPASGGASANVHRNAAAAVLDAEALARLAELDPTGAAGLVDRVLLTYRVSLQRLLGQLQQARIAADLQSQRHVAHTLKSSSASVGALALAALCAEVERILRDGPVDGLEPHLDAMHREGARVLAALTAA